MYFDLILGSNHVFNFFFKNKVKQLLHMGGTLTFDEVFFFRFLCIININTNHSYISLQRKKPEIPAAAATRSNGKKYEKMR